jgi:mannose-1-phosphate guanylyltransferase
LNGKRRNISAVVLAGGSGHRLSELTRGANGICTPKQYCSFNGGQSLLQLSLQRGLAVTSRKRIVTVVTEAHRRFWEREFLALPYSPLVVEPCSRGTYLGMLLPLLVIARSDPQAGVMFIPSDHYVEHEDLFAEFLRQATAPEVLDGDKLTLLGITPNAPDSGFGHLYPAPDSGVGMRPVHQFIEKPDQAAAAELFRAGSVWNSGIVSGRVSQFLALYRQTRQMVMGLQGIVEQWSDSRIPSAELCSLYAQHPALDFSYDVLQKCPRRLQFLTIPPCGWSDIGTPARLSQALRTVRPADRLHSAFGTQSFNLATAFDRANLATPNRASPSSATQPTFNLNRSAASWLPPLNRTAHHGK